MNYKELKEKAKSLGLPMNGKKEELEARIAEYETSHETSHETSDKTDKNDRKVAQVFVRGGGDGNVIREYSEEVHGKDYAELAKSFASKDTRRSVR